WKGPYRQHSACHPDCHPRRSFSGLFILIFGHLILPIDITGANNAYSREFGIIDGSDMRHHKSKFSL
ncbi:hypothetical protein PO883_05020, partial [Massilia sp. DJPM01]|uniref:hypothetical protein n=1 Tax=Massilia sp. DJPM01 TaxID=3024404 RepID=UPI00259E751A